MSVKWDDLQRLLREGMTKAGVRALVDAMPDELLAGSADWELVEELKGGWTDGAGNAYTPPLRRAFVWGRACERLGLPSEPKEPASIADLAERLLRLEALFVDPAELAKLSDCEVRELARMPGADLQLGRLTKIEDRLSLLEQAVARARAATSVARAGIIIDPLDGIDWQLKNIARVLERAAGVQELVASNKHLRHETTPCAHCGCRVTLHLDGSQCPSCGGQERVGEPPPEAPPDWSVATQVTVDPGGTVTVEVAGLTADEDGWRCACGRRPVLRFVADDPAKLSDPRQTVTGRPFGAKHASPSYAAEPEPSPWRDVNKELPEESTLVLVWVRSFAPPKGRTGIVKAGCDLAVRAGAKWVSDSGYEVTVSHWMPLPKEPS